MTKCLFCRRGIGNRMYTNVRLIKKIKNLQVTKSSYNPISWDAIKITDKNSFTCCVYLSGERESHDWSRQFESSPRPNMRGCVSTASRASPGPARQTELLAHVRVIIPIHKARFPDYSLPWTAQTPFVINRHCLLNVTVTLSKCDVYSLASVGNGNWTAGFQRGGGGIPPRFHVPGAAVPALSIREGSRSHDGKCHHDWGNPSSAKRPHRENGEAEGLKDQEITCSQTLFFFYIIIKIPRSNDLTGLSPLRLVSLIKPSVIY